MHDCQKFREDWIAGTSAEESACEDCRQFCEEAGTVLSALDASLQDALEPSEDYWAGFDNRLRTRLSAERFAGKPHVLRRWVAGLAIAASLVLAVTWGSLRMSGPAIDQAGAKPPERIEFARDHIAGLDPRVVKFLGQSEMFVRTFTKIEPSSREDIEDARARASQSLAGIAEQKNAAGDFAPVRITLDEYESVLREIKNLDSPADLADIQTRIKRNGLIANLKAYQPRVILTSQR